MARPDHSYATRLGHWLAALSLPVLALSGLQILRAFPSFGEKIPATGLLPLPDALPGLGEWLGGALAWHLTFAWFFLLAVALQLLDLARGGWRRIWLSPAEYRDIWPMVQHYLLRAPRPLVTQLYNPLQKLAYLLVLSLQLLVLLTGWMLLQPAAFSLQPAGAWQAVRALHFASMLGFLAFLPGHLLMVLLAGRKPFLSMCTGENARETPPPALPFRNPELPSPRPRLNL